jgi:hypothetical protein
VLESNNTSEQKNLPHACKLQSSSHEIFDVDLDVMLATIVIDVDDECVPPPKKPKKVFVDFNHKFQKLLVSGPWFQNVCTLRMRFLIFNVLKPLSSNS